MKTKIVKLFAILLMMTLLAPGGLRAQWVQVASPNVGNNKNMIREINGSSVNDVWAVGHYQDDFSKYRNLLLHWDGESWQTVTSPDPSLSWNDLFGVAALGNGEAWAVGVYNPPGGASQNEILHFDGNSWEIAESPFVQGGSSLYGVKGLSPENVWAVGLRQTPESAGPILAYCLHYDGSGWTEIEVPPVGIRQNCFYDIDGNGIGDLWAVGYWGDDLGDFNHLVMRYDGSLWEEVPVPSGVGIGSLTDVEVVGEDNVWATGNLLTGGGVILHWDGSDWTVFDGVGYFSDLAVVSENDIWAVGNVISHWDGLTWTQEDDLSEYNFANFPATWVASDGIWAAGWQNGTGGPFETLFLKHDLVISLADKGKEYAEPVLHVAQNSPNPVVRETVINFDLVRPGDVEFYCHDLLGKEVTRISLGHLSKGSHSFHYEPGQQAGLYFYYLKSGEKISETRKLIMK